MNAARVSGLVRHGKRVFGAFERAAGRSGSLALLPCILGMLALAACHEELTVRGVVLPSEAERAAVPWSHVEVRLLEGDLAEKLSELADGYRNQAEPRALERARTLLIAEHAAKTDLLRDARAAFASEDPGALADGDDARMRTCLPAAEALLAAARHDYDQSLTTIAPTLATQGIAVDAPTQALAALSASVRTKVAAESTRLGAAYLLSELSQESRTVLSPGRAMDRLCWRAQNRRDVGLQFRGITVSLDGKPLSDEVARQIWILPKRDQKLRIPNDDRSLADVLLPGAQFETCFFARGGRLPAGLAAEYGLAVSNPTRGRDWRVQWEHVSLVARGAGENGDAPSAKLFVRELKDFEAGLEETRLINTITRSPAASALARAERALIACHRAIESEQSQREVARSLDAVQRGRTDDVAAQVRLRPVLREDLRQQASMAEWLKKAHAELNDRTVARQRVDLGHSFELMKIAPGQYTLLAEASPTGSKPGLWMLPVRVDGSVERDLEVATARATPLDQMLRDALVPRRKVELRTAASEPPSAMASTQAAGN